MPEATVNGLRLHYEESGPAGRPLVCLHGISSNSRSWRHQLAGLGRNYRVIAWDARGYGRSEDPTGPYPFSAFAQDLAGLLDHLQLDRAVVVGLSMGGVIAQEFYRHYPERVQALVLADTNTGGGARPEEERRSRLEARLRALETMTQDEMARKRAPALLSPHASAELRREVVEMIAQIHPVGYRYAAIALDAADERDVLPGVKAPALVLWGEYDTVTPRSEAEAIYRAIPGARFEVIPGGGHLSNLENPSAFNCALANFLKMNLTTDEYR